MILGNIEQIISDVIRTIVELSRTKQFEIYFQRLQERVVSPVYYTS